MTMDILPDILHLFIEGMEVGGLLCLFPCMIGLAIGLIIRLIKRA